MHKKTQFKVLAIIPAKSKSRRLKDKNRKKINGLELFVHSIKIAQKSKYINKIHISTDSKSIAQKALSYGVQTPFLRPKKLSTYKSPIIKTLIFTIEKFKKELSYFPDYVVIIQPTSPLLRPRLIDQAIIKAIKKKADSVVGLLSVDTTSHPGNLRKVSKSGIVKFVNEKLHYSQIEKRKEIFYKSGGIYVTTPNTIMKKNRIEGKKNYFIIMDKISALDINDNDDYIMISKIMKKK